MRFALAVGLSLAALAGCSTLDSLNPFAGSSKPKPAELTQITPTATLATLWQASVGKAEDQIFRPAVVGSSVYAAARDGTLIRVDEGRVAWRANAGTTISGGVGSDGKLVVVGTPKGEVIAFDASGNQQWRARVTSEVLSAPAFHDRLVVVRSGDNRIFGLDAETGKQRWVYQRSLPPLTLRSSVGVTTVPGAILAGFPGGKLVAISPANGAALWESTVALPRGATELERVADVTSEPVIAGREVCAVAFQGRVTCFDLLAGTTLWSREISSSVGLDADNRYLYVADDKGAVHALDRAGGASVWRNDKLANRGVGRPLSIGRHVAVADARGIVHLLRKEDGDFAARLSTDGGPIAAPPAGIDDGMLVQSQAGGLFALSIR